MWKGFNYLCHIADYGGLVHYNQNTSSYNTDPIPKYASRCLQIM